MGTRSNIGVEYPNGLIKFVYCHWDGYLSRNGEILYNHYTNAEEVIELVNLGEISSLGETLDKTKDYHRWRGEPKNIQNTNNRNDAYQQEYVYIFSIEDNCWYCNGCHIDHWITLEEALSGSYE